MVLKGVARMLRKYQATNYEVWRLGAGTDSKGNPTKALALHATNQGFFQPQSGDKAAANNKDETTIDARLYAKLADDIQESDEIRIAGVRYRIVFRQDASGISGVQSHREIGLSYSGASQS